MNATAIQNAANQIAAIMKTQTQAINDQADVLVRLTKAVEKLVEQQRDGLARDEKK